MPILRCPYRNCKYNQNNTIDGFCTKEGEVVMQPSEQDNDLLDCMSFEGVWK